VEGATDDRLKAVGQRGKIKIEAAESQEGYVAKVDNAMGQIDKFLSD